MSRPLRRKNLAPLVSTDFSAMPDKLPETALAAIPALADSFTFLRPRPGAKC
jgi:hypothetical protein